MQAINVVLALDVGNARTGVARVRMEAGLASPLTTIEQTMTELPAYVADLVASESADALVIGVPRNLSGQDTEQTTLVKEFIEQLKQQVKIKIFEQDEALTSRKAEEELQARKKPYSRGDIDALAATYILQDFIDSHPGLR